MPKKSQLHIEQQVIASAEGILNLIPTQFDMTAAKDKFLLGEEDVLQLILLQDLNRYNDLVEIMTSTLNNLIRAIKGKQNKKHFLHFYDHSFKL